MESLGVDSCARYPVPCSPQPPGVELHLKTSNQGGTKVSKESGKDREWAFAINDKTTIKRGQAPVMAADLKPGDEVTVSYTEDGGKVIAQSVTVRDGGAGTTPAPTRDIPAGKK